MVQIRCSGSPRCGHEECPCFGLHDYHPSPPGSGARGWRHCHLSAIDPVKGKQVKVHCTVPKTRKRGWYSIAGLVHK